MRHPEAPKPIGHACARALIGLSAPDRHYAGGCPYCRGCGYSSADIWHEWETCERRLEPWRSVGDPVVDLRSFADELERQAREPLRPSAATPAQFAAVRRIRAALDADARAAVRKLLTTRPSWLPWQPIEQGHERRRQAMHLLAIRLARLTVLHAMVWLVFFAAWPAWH